MALTLHYFPSNASFAPHLLLRELGVPFTLQLVDRTQNAQKSAAYLKLNPNGLIPVLQDGDLVLYETAAILLHLVDTHPQAGLAPAVGTAERAEFGASPAAALVSSSSATPSAATGPNSNAL